MSSQPDQNLHFHERANHEDNLLIARTNMVISFNGFLAIAVGLVSENLIRIVFVALVLAIDVAWVAWAPRARRFIQSLRDAGATRPDEQLCHDTVGRSKWVNPLTIITVYMPWVLTAGWFTILGYSIIQGLR